MRSQRWQPWRELALRTDVAFRLDPLADLAGGAFYGRSGPWAVIVVSPSLDPVAQRCALGHELIHHERGITSPPASDATMVHEEVLVRREVARRLVPIEELTAYVDIEHPEGVTAEMVAEEFEVTLAVANEALRQLLEHTSW